MRKVHVNARGRVLGRCFVQELGVHITDRKEFNSQAQPSAQHSPRTPPTHSPRKLYNGTLAVCGAPARANGVWLRI